MSKLITLDQAIRERLICDGALINPDQLFTDIEKRVVITAEETGMETDQIFTREKLQWFFSKDNSYKPAIFGSFTENTLSLIGKVGYENSVNVQNKICNKLYSTEDLRLNSRAVTRLDIDMLKRSKTYELIIENEKRAWVATNYAFPLLESKSYGVEFFDYNGIYYCELFNVNGSIVCRSYSIFPVINIQQTEILVDIESKDKEGAWVIY